MDDNNGVSQNEIGGAEYYELSPFKVRMVRLYGIICFVMALVSTILLGFRSHLHHLYIYLFANIIMSSIICVLLCWYYKISALDANKWWLMMGVFTALFYQCFVSVIFAYVQESNSTELHTVAVSPHTVIFPLHTLKLHTTALSNDFKSI